MARARQPAYHARPIAAHRPQSWRAARGQLSADIRPAGQGTDTDLGAAFGAGHAGRQSVPRFGCRAKGCGGLYPAQQSGNRGDPAGRRDCRNRLPDQSLAGACPDRCPVARNRGQGGGHAQKLPAQRCCAEGGASPDRSASGENRAGGRPCPLSALSKIFDRAVHAAPDRAEPWRPGAEFPQRRGAAV